MRKEVKEVKEVNEAKDSEMGAGVARRKIWAVRLNRQKRKQSFRTQKENGQPGLPVGRNFVTGRLRLEAFLHLGKLEFCLGQRFHH